MSQLKAILDDLLASVQTRAELRDTWLKLSSEGSADQVEARRRHLAQDDRCEALVASLVETLTASQSGGMIEFELMAIGHEQEASLRSILSERGLAGLLEPSRPQTLPDMVRAWREASHALDAARQINRLRTSCEAGDLPALLTAYESECRNVDGWKRAVTTYNAIRSQLASERVDGGADVEDMNADAAIANQRRWLARYDGLREQLQTMVESLKDAGSLSFELEELEFEDRRALISAIDGGLIRQTQVQTETKTQARTATIVAEDEDVL